MIENLKKIEGNDFNIERAADEVRSLSFKNHVCVGCGICEFSCPIGACKLREVGAISRPTFNTDFSGHDKIFLNIKRSFDDMKVDIDENKCVLCGMCSGLCPANALQLTIDDVSISEIDSYPHYVDFAEINDDNCLYCQKCQTACPRDAITIERQLPSRSDLVTGEIEVSEDDCIYCGMCEELCPAEAIEVDSETGKESIVIDKDKCVYCLVCKKICPTNAIKALCRICSYGEYDLDPAKAVVKGSTIIDQDTCIKCGWCEGVCPNDAVKTKKAFTGTLEIDQGKCQNCGACIDTCPCNVLSFPVSTAPGQKLDQINKKEEYCIHCGACEKVCPNEAITVKVNKVDYTPTNSKTWIKALDNLKAR